MASAGRVGTSQATFTPAATAHTPPAVVGREQRFSGLSARTGQAMQINSASMLVSGATIETTAWRLYLYSVTPPSALADAAAFSVTAGDRASFLGYVDIAQLVSVGASLYVQSDNLNKAMLPSGGRDAFGYLVNLTTLTPQAVAHTVTLWTLE